MIDRHRATLARLQDDLQGIYGVDSDLRVADFVIDRDRWRAMSGSGAPEELLVVERDGGVEIGVFVDEAATDALVAQRSWTQARLAAHCQAVEGVSHFVYLAHRVVQPRPVSQLELELQAEVDKFITVLRDLWRSGDRHASADLRARLFEAVSYRQNLTLEQRQRYERANILAAAYCRFLEAKFVVRNAFEALLAELRRFFRMGGGEKLSYAACGAAP